MIKKDGLHLVDETRCGRRRICGCCRRAASYPEVERILVNPGIKKKLCDTVTGDRSWLRKIRPFWGHDWFFGVQKDLGLGIVADFNYLGSSGRQPLQRLQHQPLRWRSASTAGSTASTRASSRSTW